MYFNLYLLSDNYKISHYFYKSTLKFSAFENQLIYEAFLNVKLL